MYKADAVGASQYETEKCTCRRSTKTSTWWKRALSCPGVQSRPCVMVQLPTAVNGSTKALRLEIDNFAGTRPQSNPFEQLSLSRLLPVTFQHFSISVFPCSPLVTPRSWKGRSSGREGTILGLSAVSDCLCQPECFSNTGDKQRLYNVLSGRCLVGGWSSSSGTGVEWCKSGCRPLTV